MCGIAGIVANADYKRKRSNVKMMLDLLIHRGPDDEGVYEEEEVCLGHRRLSIVDLSSKASQPMIYQNKAAVVFNGEIYNFLELRKVLRKEGYIFKSNSDTEVLLLGYVHFGIDILNMIKGFFSFCIYDIEKKILFCARDPFGKKPFYYSFENKRFVFASEVGAVLKGSEMSPSPNYNGLSHYLLKGYYEPGFSAYNGIYTLKAGHVLQFDIKTKKLIIHPYHVPKFDLYGSNISDIDAVRESENLMKEAVSNRLISDVPLGTLLSGGVDSSLITLFMAEDSIDPVDAFTISFKEKEFDETLYSKKLAEHPNIHHIINNANNTDLTSLLPELVEVYGEPFGDSSSIPTFQVFDAVKNNLKVVLTGDGGDEVFGGYVGTDLYLLREKIQPLFRYFSFLLHGWPDKCLSSKYRAVRQLSHAGLAMHYDGSAAFYSLYRNAWTKHQREKFMRKDGWLKTGGNSIENNFSLKYKNSGKTDMERYLNLNLERLTEGFLVKIDRASMAHSVEVRSPMLDMDMFNFISKLPANVLFGNNVRKNIPKQILAHRMDREFAYRKKMGFTPPLATWFNNEETMKWVQGKLLNPNGITYELFHPSGIKQLISNHLKGYDNTTRLWYLLFLEEWYEKKIYI